MTTHTEPVTDVRRAAGLDELLTTAVDRTPMRNGDGKSGSRMERLRHDIGHCAEQQGR